MAETNPYQTPEPAPAGERPVVEEDRSQQPAGLGGWLILVAIGLILSPFRLGAMILQVYVPLFDDGTWEMLTTPGSEQYHALWAPLLIFELATNLAFLVAAIVLLYFFFRKSRFFPKGYIAFMLINLCFIVADAWFASFVLPDEPIFDPDTLRELSRSSIATLIWVPYMLFSKRVNNTFVV